MKKIVLIIACLVTSTGVLANQYNNASVFVNPFWNLIGGFGGGFEIKTGEESSAEFEYGQATGKFAQGVTDLTLEHKKVNLRINFYEDGYNNNSFYVSGLMGWREVKVADNTSIGAKSSFSGINAGVYVGHRWVLENGVLIRVGLGAVSNFSGELEYDDGSNTGSTVIVDIEDVPLMKSVIEPDISFSYSF